MISQRGTELWWATKRMEAVNGRPTKSAENGRAQEAASLFMKLPEGGKRFVRHASDHVVSFDDITSTHSSRSL